MITNTIVKFQTFRLRGFDPLSMLPLFLFLVVCLAVTAALRLFCPTSNNSASDSEDFRFLVS